MKVIMIALSMVFPMFFNSAIADEYNYSFLFLGDIHYTLPAFSSAEIIKDIVADIKKKDYKIDFVCHTGDLINNQIGNKSLSISDGAKEWEFALADIKKNFSMPFFMSLGNHDWYGNHTWFGGKENIEKYFLPFIAKELGKSTNGKPFYSFRWGDSYFLFTNHVGFDYGLDKEQRSWLEKSLSYAEANPAIKHVFIFGHPNLWNVEYFRFNENYELLDIIKKFSKVDAYFCGHTHHNNASVWNFGNGHKLLQINGSVKGVKKNDLTPVEDLYLILNPPLKNREYTKGFGYLMTYCVVSVKDNLVTVAFDLIGGKRIWEFSWEVPGEIREKIFLAEPHEKIMKQDDLEKITEAELFIYPFVPEAFLPSAKPLEVTFNGTKVGKIPRNSNAWDLRSGKSMKIQPDLVKLKNSISVSNPNFEQYALRDCYLMVKLKDGRKVFTPVYPYALFAGNWKNMYMNFGLSHPTAGVIHSSVEVNLPPELIKSFKIGDNVTFELNFKEK